MKRLVDFSLSLLALLVRLTSPGPTLYWSDRVGRNNVIFKMPKFRTMRIDTPTVVTHLLCDPDRLLKCDLTMKYRFQYPTFHGK